MNRYYQVSDIFEETLCSLDLLCPNGWDTRSKLLESIVELKEAKSPGFAEKLRTVIRRNMCVRHRVKFVLTLIILYILLEAFVTVTDIEQQRCLRVVEGVLVFLGGMGVASAFHFSFSVSEEDCLPLTTFTRSLVWVLWEVVEYQDRKEHTTFPKRAIRHLLLYTNIEEFEKVVTRMLIERAFAVKLLEPIRVRTDPELEEKRARFKGVHERAVELHLAKKNPKTYFDRAVPASEAPQNTPAVLAVAD